jgi:hypothetical protein
LSTRASHSRTAVKAQIEQEKKKKNYQTGIRRNRPQNSPTISCWSAGYLGSAVGSRALNLKKMLFKKNLPPRHTGTGSTNGITAPTTSINTEALGPMVAKIKMKNNGTNICKRQNTSHRKRIGIWPN